MSLSHRKASLEMKLEHFLHDSHSRPARENNRLLSPIPQPPSVRRSSRTPRKNSPEKRVVRQQRRNVRSIYVSAVGPASAATLVLPALGHTVADLGEERRYRSTERFCERGSKDAATTKAEVSSNSGATKITPRPDRKRRRRKRRHQFSPSPYGDPRPPQIVVLPSPRSEGKLLQRIRLIDRLIPPRVEEEKVKPKKLGRLIPGVAMVLTPRKGLDMGTVLVSQIRQVNSTIDKVSLGNIYNVLP